VVRRSFVGVLNRCRGDHSEGGKEHAGKQQNAGWNPANHKIYSALNPAEPDAPSVKTLLKNYGPVVWITGRQGDKILLAMRWATAGRSQLVLALLLAVALLPAVVLVYLQYKTLSRVEEQTRQAFLGNVRQALIGARVESENDFTQWLTTTMTGTENHGWLQRRQLDRIQDLAELAKRICPHLSLFFAYRTPPKGRPEVFVFRPAPDRRHMFRIDGDAAAADIPALVATIQENPKTLFYSVYGDLDGERHQLFIHRVDREENVRRPDGTISNEHFEKLGYYGFAIPTRVLAQDYFPALLRKHLARLASTDEKPLGAEAVGGVFDETGKQLFASKAGVAGPFTVREHLDRQKGVLPGWTIQAGFPSHALGHYARSQFLRGLGVTLGITAVMLVAIGFIGVTAAREMRLSRAKSEFVANVSHELKTPLSLIRGFAETLHLNRLSNPADREEYFRIIESEILRLSIMIDKILELSKIEVGIKRYHPEMTDLGAVVDETLHHFSYELEKKGFKLEREIEEPRPVAPVDRQALSQALLNLLSNAVKYSDSHRYIGVRVARRNGHVEVSVSDRGIGIPRDEQGRIFEKFYRVDSHAAGKTAGAGLGLALVKHFAEGHGGAVNVDSVPGEGSTFTIVLPAA